MKELHKMAQITLCMLNASSFLVFYDYNICLSCNSSVFYF